MKFLDENFLLQSAAARRLYHEFAADQPIIDYHCHLSPKDIAEDRQFENLTQIWLAGDHYKWRAMRAAGVSEEYITGDASDWEKFQAWAETVPKTLRNPLYHWTHLELRRPFGIEGRLLSPDTAKSIWDECNAKLQTPEFSVRGIMRQMNVRLVCTTDDPIDSLEYHQEIRRQTADGSFDIQVLPTFRPDKAMPSEFHTNIEFYVGNIKKLGDASGTTIKTLDDLLEVLAQRHQFFHEHGCRLSDHGCNRFSFYHDLEKNREIADQTFQHILNGGSLNTTDTQGEDAQNLMVIDHAVLYHVAELDTQKDWTMQLHIGAFRNNNARMFEKLGRDSGFDSIADDYLLAESLSNFFDMLDYYGDLPKTIVYNLNPTYNDLIAAMLGNFQDGVTPGKMQFGSGWWFLDQKKGMEDQLNALSNHGLLSQFVGMLTDSRSFLSFTRHEYFRRILCNLLGTEMEQGLLPSDYDFIGEMVKNICYENAKNYFGFNLPE